MTTDMSEGRAITVLTCQGDVSDPSFPRKLQKLVCKLHRLVNRGKRKDEFQVTKVEPWNSVRVTFNIPREAAERLQRLAESGDRSLREMGILSVQVDGDQIITLTLANSLSSVNLNLNQAIELGVTTTSAPSLRCNTADPSPSSSSSSPCPHRVSDSSPPASLRDVLKNHHPTAMVVASSSRSVSSISSVSPSRGLSTPPTPPDSVSLESRPESASLEESSNDPLKSQLLHSSFSVNLNSKSTNSSVNVQNPPDSNRMIIKDPNDPLMSQVTIDVSETSSPHNGRGIKEPFRSPNVLVTDPLHIVPNVGVSSSSSPSVSPSVSSAMVLSAIIPTGKRRSSSSAVPGQMVSVPFPFTSMQHASLHSRQGNLNNSNNPRPPLQVSVDKFHEVDPTSRNIDTIQVPSCRVTLSGPSITTSSLRGSEVVSAAKSASSNVALTSPLLVNLLQTESSQESKSSLKSTKIAWNESQIRTNDSDRSSSSSHGPKSDLKPNSDLLVPKPAILSTVSASSSTSSSAEDVTMSHLDEAKTVSCTLTKDNPVNPRQLDLVVTSRIDSSNSMRVVVTSKSEGRNGSMSRDEEVDQDLRNPHDYPGPVVNDAGKRRDEATNDTRIETYKLVNCHRSEEVGQSNHVDPTELVTGSHTNNRNSTNKSHNQPSVNGKHNDEEKMEDDEEEEDMIAEEEDEEILDDDEELDELSDLPPLEPANMAMDMDDDCSSNELCRPSTTPTLNCVFADQEAVSLGSLDGRQVYSVASGDHNYISVKTENQLDTNCRSDSVGEDPTHSDFESQPNFKCSEEGFKNSEEKDNVTDQIALSLSSSSAHRKVTDTRPEGTSHNKEIVTNNCHPKKPEEPVLDRPSSQCRNKQHITNRTKSPSGGCKKLLLADSSSDQTSLSSAPERRVNSSKMKITSESLSADLYLVNSVPIQPDAQSSSVEEVPSFFQPESNHTAVSILKKKKSKGGGVASQQTPGPGSGVKRRRVVKDGGGTNNNNNRL